MIDVLREYLIKSLDDSEERIRFEAIHSLAQLGLTRLEDIQERVLSVVATDTDRVSGLAIASLMWRTDRGSGPFAILLSVGYPTHPVSTLIAHVALGIVLAAEKKIPLSFDISGSIPSDKAAESRRLVLSRIAEDVFRFYVLRYLMTLLRGASFAKSDQSLEFLALTTGPFENLMDRIGRRLAWGLRFLSLASEDMGRSQAVRQLLDNGSDDFYEKLEVQQWMVTITGHGRNVFDSIYHLPEKLEERRHILLELVETGGGDTTNAWWTRLSAVEKLANEEFLGDPIVCRELLRRLQEFKVAENAGATREVGMFKVMYVPTWPYGEKGAYRELTQALAKIGGNDIALELRELMTASPYPELLLDAIDLIERPHASVGHPHCIVEPADVSEQARTAYELGLAAVSNQDWGRAITDFERAVADSPEFMSAWYQLWWVCIQLDRIEEAMTALKRVDELDPDSPDILANLGVLYGIKGDDERAEELLDRAISLDGACEEALINKAALIGKNDGESAEVAYLWGAVLKCPFSPAIFRRAEELKAFSS